MDYIEITEEENYIAESVFKASQEVLAQLGPGMLESTYESCLEYELKQRGFQVERQVPIQLKYKNITINESFRIDLWINRKVVVELKAVNDMNDIYLAQLNTYLKLTNCNLGLLINFNVSYIGKGFKRWIVRK